MGISMRNLLQLTVCLNVLSALSVKAHANDPTDVPWPVATTVALMNSTKTLMNSYGDPQNNWDEMLFHCGIDIDSYTESPIASDVRCVINDAVISHWFYTPLGPNPAEWTVVTTEGTGSSNHEDYGWAYQHLNDPRVLYGPDYWDQVDEGDLIQTMNIYVPTVHTHFKWTTWDHDSWCYVNPLNQLLPRASGTSFNWTFNPSGYANSFELFFLDQTEPANWPATPGAVTMLAPDNLSGPIDAFVGFGLSGIGQSTTPSSGRNDLAPERIEWRIERSTNAGPQTLEQRYLVNFDCPLSYQPDERVQQLYFKFDLDEMFSYTSGDHEGLIVCLTNCGNIQGWENLGIDNIEENCWQTNGSLDGTSETINPILAGYPDGTYMIEATLYAHTHTPDPATELLATTSCELHNFHPALREVIISDAITDQTYYHGEWVPGVSGLEAILDIDPNSAAPAGADLEIILVFTEEMDTSAGIDVSLGPLDVTNGTWGASVVNNDMWTGEVSLPTSLTDGVYTLLVRAEDIDGNSLMDPEGAGTVPGPSYDCHHALQLGYPAGVEWTRSLHADVYGSPKLADVDGDGDLEIAFQCIDGWADLRGDNGYSLPGWPNDHYFSPGDPLVTASPAFGDFTGSPNPEIIFMNEIGSYVWNANGVLQFTAGWFRWTVNSSPVIADLDNDNSNEFLIGRQFQTGTTYYLNLVAKETDGSSYWYKDLGEDASITATPSICDVDNNSSGLEVIVITDATEYSQTDGSATVRCFVGSGGANRWDTVVNGEEITSAVVTANTDDDIAIEVIVAGVSAGENQVKVLQGTTGYVEATFTVSGSVDAGVSVADINQDGYNDIVLSSSGNGGTLYCWGWNGSGYSSLSGFPVSLGTWTDDGVSIGDIDGDGMLELVLAGKDGNLHAINHDGTIASGFPLVISSSNPLSGQPAIGDIDSDGRLEIVFFELNSSLIHCVELGENTAFNYLPWPAVPEGCSEHRVLPH
jgi:hypothetical protein